jgi:protein gp37
MALTSGIEWTNSTFNPWIGCTKIASAEGSACDFCYAVQFGRRLGVQWGNHDRKRTRAEYWKQLPKWNADGPRFLREHGHRQRVFSASLADWLDNQVDPQWRYDFCREVDNAPNLDFLLLTKRPENFRKLAPANWQDGPPSNVWLGVTVEDEDRYRDRFAKIAQIPASVYFLSYEPGLGPLGSLDFGIGKVPDWIISGGESGVARERVRLIPPDAVRQARDQSNSHGVAFFHKQWGNYWNNPLVMEQGMSVSEARAIDPDDGPNKNGKGGGLLDGRLWREFPVPRAA